ncbi:MAG: hypothetical protein Q4B63_01410 [Clostridium perfringens]|nr:hypothetical protein [Clostridium perfringens]
MKRRTVIAIIVITIGTTIGGGMLFITNKTNAISKNEEVSNLDKDSEENNKDLDDKSEKIEDNKSSSDEFIDIEENKEQTLLEGYEIFYKVEDFFQERNYEEASRLYNTITNEEALAKIDFFKEELDYYMGLYDYINRAKELYESGSYELARVVLYNVTGSNPSNKQIELTNDLLSKIENKIAERGEKEFTFDLAVEYLKLWFNYDENNIYEDAPVEILDDGSKRYLILVKDKRYPENDGYYYSVGEDGRVTGD